MRGLFAISAAILACLLLSPSLPGKGGTVRVIIKGGNLAAPIEIADPAVVERFQVYTGPGTSRQLPDGTTEYGGGQSLIVDWDRGTTKPPEGATVYSVLFVTTRTDVSTYIVHYAIDASSGEGYVYIPGKGEPEYRDNVWQILRRVEGSWFHAWSVWEKLANPLIAGAPKTVR
jgi:hypothetical protein